MEEELKINGKALYTTKGAAREYGRIGCNFYTGCPNGCEYCYLKRGAPSKLLGGTEVRLKKCFKDEADAELQFCKELLKWYDQCKKYGIFLSFTTDPLIFETRELTRQAIINALFNDVPVYILTKDASFINDECGFMVWMDNILIPSRDLVHFGFTLTGRDDFEPNASKNADRIKAMRKMARKGFPTFASIEPVIDWKSAERMVEESLPWCDHYKLGLRSGVGRKYYNMAESVSAVDRIIRMCEENSRTIYLKESTRKLLQRVYVPRAFRQMLTHTVDMDGNRITNNNP